jgi:hypothetical protein
LGVIYGNEGVLQFTGNVRVPPANKVETGYAYDSEDTVIGTLDPAVGEMPDPEDVRFGVPVQATTGVLQLPAESQVLIGVGYGAYGTEFEGTLTDTPGGTGAILPPVNTDGSLRSPLIIGDDYTGDTAFKWQITGPGGFDAGTATAVFRGWVKSCGTCPENYAWESTGTIIDTAGTWDLTFDLLSAVTDLIDPGEYEWSVSITDGGNTITITGSFEHYTVMWIC